MRLFLNVALIIALLAVVGGAMAQAPLASPYLDAAQKALGLIKTTFGKTQSSTVGELQQRDGFMRLNTISISKQGRGTKEAVLKILNRTVVEASGLSVQLEAATSRNVTLYSKEDGDLEDNEGQLVLHTADAPTATFNAVAYCFYPVGDGKWAYAVRAGAGTGAIANDIYIATSGKSSYLKSRVDSYYKEMATPVRPAHWAALMDVMFSSFGGAPALPQLRPVTAAIETASPDL